MKAVSSRGDIRGLAESSSSFSSDHMIGSLSNHDNNNGYIDSGGQ